MKIKTSNQIDSDVYADAIAIRRAVFVQEQHIDEALEIDTVTPATWYYVGYDDTGKPVATARVTPNDPTTGHIQRVATLKAARGHGYARQLLNQIAVDEAAKGYQQLVLGAQVTAQSFYAELGYQPTGAPFMEAGLRHKNMVKVLTPAN
ncbi:GNAT family N-acetyltransferase [Lactiplantibacillus pentosus]|uniref:GNAT family N-acetyltransferase n=1 Tax=Lactiplantibacillus pentosus TaxID=1589 RepID=UPI003C21ADFB